VVRFAAAIVESERRDVGIDWHGHRDRDMGTINSLAALEAGASRVHGTMLGIGERVGQHADGSADGQPRLMGWIERDLTHSTIWCRRCPRRRASRFPTTTRSFGRDAFRTQLAYTLPLSSRRSTRTTPSLADTVYSGVPAADVGQRAADRDRTDVRPIERRLLARTPGHRR
jgi:2-isopropylmalate synthase